MIEESIAHDGAPFKISLSAEGDDAMENGTILSLYNSFFFFSFSPAAVGCQYLQPDRYRYRSVGTHRAGHRSWASVRSRSAWPSITPVALLSLSLADLSDRPTHIFFFPLSFPGCVLLDHIPSNPASRPTYSDPTTYTKYYITVMIPDVQCNK